MTDKDTLRQAVYVAITKKDTMALVHRAARAAVEGITLEELQAIDPVPVLTAKELSARYSKALDFAETIKDLTDPSRVLETQPRVDNIPPSAESSVGISFPSNSREKTMTDKATIPALTPAILTLSGQIGPKITIDKTTGVASFGDATFNSTLAGHPTLTEGAVDDALSHLNLVASATAHAFGLAAAAFSKANPEFYTASPDNTAVTGKFPGPKSGGMLNLSYKPVVKMPAGDGFKEHHGVMVTSWKGIGGPGGKDYASVKEAVRLASEN